MSRSTARVVGGVLIGALGLSANANAQGGTSRGALDVRVTVAGTDVPLSNAVVAVVGGDTASRLTNAQGRAAFDGVAFGDYRVQARHIGYRPVEARASVREGRTTLNVELSHVAVQLAALNAVARQPCTRPGLPSPDDTTGGPLLTIMQQIAQNAAQQRLIMDEYPYQLSVERTLSRVDRDSATHVIAIDSFSVGGRRYEYAPGQVLRMVRGPVGAVLQMTIPTFVNFTEPAFQANHCFAFGGVADDRGRARLRVEFWPSDKIDDPDVEGEIFLDTATYEVMHVNVNLSRADQAPRSSELTGITTSSDYGYIAPSVAVTERFVGRSSYRPTRGAPRIAAIEERNLIGVRFLKATPGDTSRVAAPRTRPPGPSAPF